MPCILSDDYNYNKFEEPAEIPKQPVCRPKKVENFINIYVFSMFISGFLLLFIGRRILEHIDNAFISVVSCFILSCILPFFAARAYCRHRDKKLQDPSSNPQGYAYQGRVLSKDEPHYLLHLEYYKRHKTWTIPDGVNPKDYISQEQH